MASVCELSLSARQDRPPLSAGQIARLEPPPSKGPAELLVEAGAVQVVGGLDQVAEGGSPGRWAPCWPAWPEQARCQPTANYWLEGDHSDDGQGPPARLGAQLTGPVPYRKRPGRRPSLGRGYLLR
jgi:hypothetical protein